MSTENVLQELMMSHCCENSSRPARSFSTQVYNLTLSNLLMLLCVLYYNMIICISKSLNHHYLLWHVFHSYLPAEQVMPNQHIADTFFDLDILWHASFRYFPVHRQVESQLRQNSAERDTISGWQFFHTMICFSCNTFFPFSNVHY